MRTGWRLVAELGLGVLRARGVDAVSFLQGQLSNDTMRLRSGQLQLTGYHTPQGRTIALLRLTALAPDDLLAVLPQELVPIVVARLKRYVLRAKVQISDDTANWEIRGYSGAAAAPSGSCVLPYGDSRHLVLIPEGAGASAEMIDGTRADWVACDIAEGLPQVYLATSEAFVAQMLNLDVTNGIALDKGCYTGQEIIARAHYRGHVKRRMQRFISETPCTLLPGQSGKFPDGRGFKVVDAVAAEQGRSEFLAVTNPLGLGTAGLTEDAELATAGDTQTLVTADRLPLPYEIPTGRG